jgi:hypothetical protein
VQEGGGRLRWRKQVTRLLWFPFACDAVSTKPINAKLSHCTWKYLSEVHAEPHGWSH